MSNYLVDDEDLKLMEDALVALEDAHGALREEGYSGFSPEMGVKFREFLRGLKKRPEPVTPSLTTTPPPAGGYYHPDHPIGPVIQTPQPMRIELPTFGDPLPGQRPQIICQKD
jgi:hypothetical protein